MPVSVQEMDKGFMHSCNHDASAQKQHTNLQIKAHRSDFTSPGDTFQHFPRVSCPRTTPPCSLQGALSSRLLPCPGAQLRVLLPSRVRLPEPSPTLGPRNLGRAWFKCESCLCRSTLKSTASCRHRYPGCTQKAQGRMLMECPSGLVIHSTHTAR